MVGVWVVFASNPDSLFDRIPIPMNLTERCRQSREAAKAAKQFKPGTDERRNVTQGPKKLVNQNSGSPANDRDFQAEHANSTTGQLATDPLKAVTIELRDLLRSMSGGARPWLKTIR